MSRCQPNHPQLNKRECIFLDVLVDKICNALRAPGNKRFCVKLPSLYLALITSVTGWIESSRVTSPLKQLALLYIACPGTPPRGWAARPEASVLTPFHLQYYSSKNEEVLRMTKKTIIYSALLLCSKYSGRYRIILKTWSIRMLVWWTHCV